MGYRKIEVKGVPCKYVIGRTHVKIQVPGNPSRAFPIEQVGSRIEKHDFNEITQAVEVCGYSPWSVTPANIERHIRGYFDLTSK